MSTIHASCSHDDSNKARRDCPKNPFPELSKSSTPLAKWIVNRANSK